MSNTPGLPQHSATRTSRGAARRAVAVLLAFAALLTIPVARAGTVTISRAQAAQAANDQFLTEQAPTPIRLPDDWATSRPGFAGSDYLEFEIFGSDGADRIIKLTIAVK